MNEHGQEAVQLVTGVSVTAREQMSHLSHLRAECYRTGSQQYTDLAINENEDAENMRLFMAKSAEISELFMAKSVGATAKERTFNQLTTGERQ